MQDNLNRIKACYDAAKDKGAETPTKKHVDDEPRERGMDPDTDGACFMCTHRVHTTRAA